MKIDKTTGVVEFGSIAVSPETLAEEVQSRYHDMILQINGTASDKKIILQNEAYWVRLNFNDSKLAQIDFTQVCDGKPPDDDDDVWELLSFMTENYGKQPGAPYWETLNFSGGGPHEPPIGGLSFKRIENPKPLNSFQQLLNICSIAPGSGNAIWVSRLLLLYATGGNLNADAITAEKHLNEFVPQWYEKQNKNDQNNDELQEHQMALAVQWLGADGSAVWELLKPHGDWTFRELVEKFLDALDSQQSLNNLKKASSLKDFLKATPLVIVVESVIGIGYTWFNHIHFEWAFFILFLLVLYSVFAAAWGLCYLSAHSNMGRGIKKTWSPAKLILSRLFDCHWGYAKGKFGKIRNIDGKLLLELSPDNLLEVRGRNEDFGGFALFILKCLIRSGTGQPKRVEIDDRYINPAVMDFFLFLDGFDHSTYQEIVTGPVNSEELLWKRPEDNKEPEAKL